jgi:hypothetical protein
MTNRARGLDGRWIDYWYSGKVDRTFSGLADELEVSQSLVSKWRHEKRYMSDEHRRQFRRLLHVSAATYKQGPPNGRR